MLNPASKAGIIEILSLLDDQNVVSLAATVTQGLLKQRIKSREDAITAVLNYSPNALSFLRRKVITREILLTYLHQKNVPISMPVTKADLVEKIAGFWDIQFTNETNNADNSVESGSVDQLAEQFVHWFYNMLNKNVCMNQEHFYADAKLQINMIYNGQCTSETVEGDVKQIVQQLFLLRMKFNLIFNPNCSAGGVQGRVDPHGLVLVLVCGTLHVDGICVGVFEQIFGLVRDPLFDNNWKIKTTEINLRSESGVTQLPTLENSTFFALT